MSSDDTTQNKRPNPRDAIDPAAAREAAARAAEASGLSVAHWLSDAVKEAGTQEAEDAALAAATAQGTSLSDWLNATIKQAGSDSLHDAASVAAAAAAKNANATLPDWLSDTIKEASVEEARAAASIAAKDSGASLPDWLSDAIKEASIEEARAAASIAAKDSGASLPDWLSDAIKEASVEEARTAASSAAKDSGASLPDWLSDAIKEASAEEARAAAPTAAPATAAPETSPASADEDGDETLPDWLTEAIREASSEQARNAAASDDGGEALPDWLADAIREVSAEELGAASEAEPHKAAPQAPAPTPQAPKRLTALPQTARPVAEPPKEVLRETPKPVPISPVRAPSPPAARTATPIATLAPKTKPPAPVAHGGGEDVRRVPLASLTPSRFQMRTGVEAAEIEALAESIRAHGVLQPILVRARGAGAVPAYEIIAGERRWRASQKAGLFEAPVSVIEVPDREAMEIALAENLQRHDLAPLDEAEGYRRLVEDMGDTQEHLAQVFGKSRGHISNMLRLLRLPEPVKALLTAGKLSAGHARALLAVADPVALAERAVHERLTVREIERIGRDSVGDAPARHRVVRRGPAPRDPDLEQIEEELSRLFGVTVKIGLRGAGERGSLTIRFKGLEQLHELIERLRL